jgi:nucleoside-diphosphate-sugar epimerase
MIHGAGNKGNLNSLVRFVKSGIPWPLGKFENKRSFCTIGNLVFILNELLIHDNIPSGIYHVADSEAVSTNEIIHLINQETKRKAQMLPLPKEFILFIAKLGDLLHFPLNSFFLDKLVSDFIVSNRRIMQFIGKPLPLTTKEGLSKSIKWLIGNNPPLNK